MMTIEESLLADAMEARDDAELVETARHAVADCTPVDIDYSSPSLYAETLAHNRAVRALRSFVAGELLCRGDLDYLTREGVLREIRTLAR